MKEDGGLERLLFELASESRLSILRELQKENLRMQEIARRLDVTPTETFRQLERLSAASLVQRQPDGTFALAEYGRLMLCISASLDFASKYREYLSTHELTRLPGQFVSRLGELSQAELETDTIETLNKGAKWFTEAERYIWAMGEGSMPEHMIPVMNEHVRRGLEIRMLLPEDRLPSAEGTARTPRNVEIRSLSECPAIIALTEKKAGVTFRRAGGKMDYAGFWGDDPAFHNWVRDLFLCYWEKGKRALAR
jgi:predicted transcriptional regulator